jgi:hypothetical protein
MIITRESHGQYLKDKRFVYSLTMAIGLLVAGFFVNFYAGIYATKEASNAVTDIILDNIPVFDVDWIFIYGAVAFIVIVAILCIMRPRYAPFTLKSVSLFVFVRSFFIMLTHIAPAPNHTPLDVFNAISKLTFGGDLFFSGHTGLPFLLALIFWGNKKLRYSFLVASIIGGVIVLMGHLHYSIDVFAAFFITYAIFHISEYLFKSDRILFKTGSFEVSKWHFFQ